MGRRAEARFSRCCVAAERGLISHFRPSYGLKTPDEAPYGRCDGTIDRPGPLATTTEPSPGGRTKSVYRTGDDVREAADRTPAPAAPKLDEPRCGSERPRSPPAEQRSAAAGAGRRRVSRCPEAPRVPGGPGARQGLAAAEPVGESGPVLGSTAKVKFRAWRPPPEDDRPTAFPPGPWCRSSRH